MQVGSKQFLQLNAHQHNISSCKNKGYASGLASDLIWVSREVSEGFEHTSTSNSSRIRQPPPRIPVLGPPATRSRSPWNLYVRMNYYTY